MKKAVMKQDSARDSLIRLEDCGEEIGGAVYKVQQVTQAVPIHVNLQWRIEKFRHLMSVYKPGDVLTSKRMSFPPAPDVMWQVSVYPNGYRPESRENLCCFLDQVTMDPDAIDHEEAHANCRIHLLAENGDRLWLWENPVVKHEQLEKAIWTNGSLVVVCEFKYLPPIGAITADEKRVELEPRQSMIAEEGEKASYLPELQAIEESSLKEVATPPSITYVVSQENASHEALGRAVTKKRVTLSLELESSGNGSGPGNNDVSAGGGIRDEGPVGRIADDKEVDAVARLLHRLALSPSVPAAAKKGEEEKRIKPKRGKKRCAIS